MSRPDLITPYDPDFLDDGFVVPLPALTSSLRSKAFADGAVIVWETAARALEATSSDARAKSPGRTSDSQSQGGFRLDNAGGRGHLDGQRVDPQEKR
jgi:hypothetical protein